MCEEQAQNRQAKADMVAKFQTEIQDKDEKINVLQTQVCR